MTRKQNYRMNVAWLGMFLGTVQMNRQKNMLQSGAGLSAPEQHLRLITRRKFFQHCGTGMGALALASLLNENLFAAANASTGSSLVKEPHFAPKAKNIIYLFMSGAPSHWTSSTTSQSW